MTFPDIMVVIGSTLFGVFAILFVIIITATNTNRRKLKESWLFEEYPTACAGSPSDYNSSVFMRAPSIRNNIFKSKTGEPLDPSLYYQYVVDGNSMKFCGIESGSLIFVKKGFSIRDIVRFPVVLVLKRLEAYGNRPQFKVRRAWKICKINDNFPTIIRNIINSSEFQDLKKMFLDKNAYDGDENLIQDFEKIRLPRYFQKFIDCDYPKEDDMTVVISTTFDTENNVIHFSIHPASSIIGIVSECFITKPEK